MPKYSKPKVESYYSGRGLKTRFGRHIINRRIRNARKHGIEAVRRFESAETKNGKGVKKTVQLVNSALVLDLVEREGLLSVEELKAKMNYHSAAHILDAAKAGVIPANAVGSRFFFRREDFTPEKLPGIKKKINQFAWRDEKERRERVGRLYEQGLPKFDGGKMVRRNAIFAELTGTTSIEGVGREKAEILKKIEFFEAIDSRNHLARCLMKDDPQIEWARKKLELLNKKKRVPKKKELPKEFSTTPAGLLSLWLGKAGIPPKEQKRFLALLGREGIARTYNMIQYAKSAGYSDGAILEDLRKIVDKRLKERQN